MKCELGLEGLVDEKKKDDSCLRNDTELVCLKNFNTSKCQKYHKELKF